MTEAPQGTNSVQSIMNPAKQQVTSRDLLVQLARANVKVNFGEYFQFQFFVNNFYFDEKINYPPPRLLTPMQRQPSLKAMRILTAIPPFAREIYAKAFFKARWVDNWDLTDNETIKQIVHSITEKDLAFGSLRIGSVEEILSSNRIKEELFEQTRKAAVERGIFGVPTFWVRDRFFWGADRMFLVKRYLGQLNAVPSRLLVHPIPKKLANQPTEVNFFFDFSSPWSYLGAYQIEEAVRSTGARNISINYIPILLGGLFKNIGTPNMPVTALSEAKRSYFTQDLKDWVTERNIPFRFTSHFPLRSVLPLRVIIAAKDCCADGGVSLVHQLYRAVWVDDIDISDKNVLGGLLEDWGLQTDLLLHTASSNEFVKEQLFKNTRMAEELGCCGVPSFQVDGSPVIWGQDRLNVVQDLICGWEYPIKSSSSL